MIIKLVKFGDFLISRPDGKEAYLAAKAYTLPKDKKEKIVFDFENVLVMAPSWADEFVTKIMQDYKDVEFVNTSNKSVKGTLEILKIRY